MAPKFRIKFEIKRQSQAEELQQVEQLVNEWIQGAHSLQSKEMPIAEAKAAGKSGGYLSGYWAV